ncbi:MAG: primosomal protein N' [Akkermansia sp.]
MLSAHVLVDGASDLAFSYAIPPNMTGIAPGCRVKIPLRNRTAMGTVLAIHEAAIEWQDKLKPLLQLIDPEPLISPELMQLASWAASYYAVPHEQMIRCLLPESIRQENTSAKTVKVATLLRPPTSEEEANIRKRAPKQAIILDYLSNATDQKADLSEMGGTSALAPARSLVAKGLISLEDIARHRDPCADEQFSQSKPFNLNPGQQGALDNILHTYESTESKKQPILLQGITGSGKTEVYLQAVEHIVRSGKSALILVPEISLTPQTLQRFKSRFASLPGSVAVLHSLLSAGERFDEWHAIRQGKARIVIGPRSAVFAPMQDLGIIVVDEEHDASYKQESSPRYHGRDIAVLRAHLEHAVIVLGSATPSLESIHNVQTGKYQIARLDQRSDGQRLPLIRILDMKTEGKNKPGPAILSERLRISIDDRLTKGEQVILLLNRRGFARSLQCPDCGHVMTCAHCSLPLTYHREEDRLMCHLCGYQEITPRVCPECKSANILLQGYGTEKVEEILKKIFRSARIKRIDADIAKRKNAVRDILQQFRLRKIDILLGTQMIAKGLDFPNVTLVGVLNADTGLYIPDPRAGEKTFQLLTQVAGRAGRGDIDGEVIIQTFTPQSPSLLYARQHDCDGFAEQELEMRQMFHLPPFIHLAILTVRSPHDNMAEFAMQTIVRRLKEVNEKGISLTDPMPAPIPKAHGQFRYQITLKSSSARLIAQTFNKVMDKLPLGEDTTAILDIDAYSFM